MVCHSCSPPFFALAAVQWGAKLAENPMTNSPCVTSNPVWMREWIVTRAPIWVFYDHTNYLNGGGALNREISGSAAEQGWCAHARRPAIVGAFTTLLDGRMCYCWNSGWEARRPDLAGAFAPNRGGDARRPAIAGGFTTLVDGRMCYC